MARDGEQHWLEAVLRAAGLVMGSALVIGALASHWVARFPLGAPGAQEWFPRALILVVGVALLIAASSRLGPQRRQAGDLHQPTREWVEEQQRQGASRHRKSEHGKSESETEPGKSEPGMCESESTLAFIQMITNPAHLRARVVESVALCADNNSIKQRISVEYRLPYRLGEKGERLVRLWVPVLRPLKGELLDDFGITDASGSSLATLSHEENIEFAALALRALFSALGGGRVPEELERVELGLLTIIATRGGVNQALIKATWAEARERLLAALGEKVALDRRLELLEWFFRTLAISYPVIVSIQPPPGEDRFLIKYERTIVPTTTVGGLRGRLRMALGLSPYQISIPVDHAFSSDSYHLRVEGPSDQYVASQNLRCARPACRASFNRRWAAGPAPEEAPSKCDFHHVTGGRSSTPYQDYHFHVKARKGQSHCHLYMRGFVGSGFRDLEFVAGFGERPPGDLSKATITAGVTAVLVVAVGYLTRSFAAGNVSDMGSDIPALMLAVPGIAAGWFGFAADTGALFRSSLAARVSLIVSGLLSLVAAILYLLENGSVVMPSPVDSVELAGINDLYWLLLSVAAYVNLIITICYFVVRYSFFKHLLIKKDGNSGPGVTV
jgi:hypothetical protein